MALNFAFLLSESARRDPHRVALRTHREELTYGALERGSTRVGQALKRLGVRPGQRVCFWMPNGVEFCLLFFGILGRGAVAVPVNPQLNPREVKDILSRCRPALWVAPRALLNTVQLLPRLRAVAWEELDEPDEAPGKTAGHADWETTGAEDTAVILFTSGSTGQAKGIELSHWNLYFAAQAWADGILKITPSDVSLAVLPLSHSYGLNGALLSFLYAGASVFLRPRFEAAEVARDLRDQGVTVLLGVSTMFHRLLALEKEQTACWRLRFCVSGATRIGEELVSSFESRFGIRILKGYGSTEMFRSLSYTADDLEEPCPHDGRPVYGAQIRVVDVKGDPRPPGEAGELWIKSPGLMKGYFRDARRTRQVVRNGWFATRDLARVHADRSVTILGRKDHLILRGGYSIQPEEIERVLRLHPQVRDARVLGVPHLEMGQEIRALVVLKKGSSVTTQDILAHCRQQLALFKCPRFVEFRTSLPPPALPKSLRLEAQENQGS
ncbi:MAG: AMP-binding protein [Acidobacteria bacterium]|nr:AMP-binding protein [Acidobacteriota bacterium]